ncbi:MAG: SIMPL domain-containing protein [Fibrobacter sp.]|nr:SIMPL domain-containing protein [Fibrobacter sp.]
MKSYIKEAIILAVAIICVGVCFYNACVDAKDKDRIVAVKGLSEREVNADYVIWPIAFKEAGDNLKQINSILDNKYKIIEKFLLDNGIEKSEFERSTTDIEDHSTNIYEAEKARTRYTATLVVTLATNKIEKAKAIMAKQGDLMNFGIGLSDNDYRYRKIFNFTKLNDIKPEMIEEATKNAELAAVKFANLSKSKLGKIKSASQGQFTIEDRDENTPFIKKIRVVTNIQYFLED